MKMKKKDWVNFFFPSCTIKTVIVSCPGGLVILIIKWKFLGIQRHNAKCDAYKCLWPPKTQRYSVYNNIKQRKQQILISERQEPANVWQESLTIHHDTTS